MSTTDPNPGRAKVPELRVLIRTGRLLDVRAASVLDRAAILVHGDRIAAVIPSGDPEPDHDRTLDLSALTVLPGLIDCHVHLIGGVASGGVTPPDDPPELDLLHGVANARATLAAGFTTVRDVGTVRAFADIRLRDGIEVGLVPGPRMLCAGVYVTAAGGGADPEAAAGPRPGAMSGTARRGPAGAAGARDPLRRGIIGSVADARRVVDDLAREGADLVKIIVTGGGVVARPTDPDRLELSPELVAAVVEAASRRGLPVAAAAHGSQGMLVAARAGVRTIEHGTYASEPALEALAAAGTYLVTDLYSGPWIDARSRSFGWSDEVIERNVQVTRAKVATVGLALRLGVRMAFGTDAGVFPHGENAGQFAKMGEAGMSPWQAIQAGTIVAAEALGAADDLGVLEPGHLADLVATTDDPLSDLEALTRPQCVVKGGQVVAGGA